MNSSGYEKIINVLSGILTRDVEKANLLTDLPLLKHSEMNSFLFVLNSNVHHCIDMYKQKLLIYHEENLLADPKEILISSYLIEEFNQYISGYNHVILKSSKIRLCLSHLSCSECR